MAEPSVTLACRNYDGTNALIRGRLGIPGMNLRVDEVYKIQGQVLNLDISTFNLAL
jgi:hypothetical protein